MTDAPAAHAADEPDLDDLERMSVDEAQLVTSMRIYDVLLAIYTHMDEVKAEALMDIHAEGKLVGPVPVIDLGGLFSVPPDDDEK